MPPIGGCRDRELAGHRGDPNIEENKLAYFPLCWVAIELLSDPLVSTENLSSVISVRSVRALAFLRVLRVLRGWKIRDFPCDSVVNLFPSALSVVNPASYLGPNNSSTSPSLCAGSTGVDPVSFLAVLVVLTSEGVVEEDFG